MSRPSDPLSPALEHLLLRFGEMVRRVGRRHDLAEADVDELIQDVRIRLWHALSTGEKIQAVQASYVYRTAMSSALDLIRRRRARREEELHVTRESGEQVLEPSITRDRPDVRLEQSELAEQVSRAVDAIPPSRRPVVRMYLAGYQREEIAALLGWTEPKTRNLLYRGLADLREELSRLGIGPQAVT